MRLFVTGGTGFVGSHFVEQALAAGHDVLALRRTDQSATRIKLLRQPSWLTKPMKDVSPMELVDCDALVHLAAAGVVVSQDACWSELLQTNVLDSLMLCESAVAAGVERFVVAGSCFEYGRAADRYKFIPPDAPLEPTTFYAASKAAASVAFMAFAADMGVRLSIHRIFHAFGEGEPAVRLWPSLRRAAKAGEDLPMSPGEQIRDFMPIEQVASKLLEAVTDEAVTPGRAKVENVGTGRPQTIREFAEQWWRHWEATGRLLFGALPYRAEEVMRYVPLVGGDD
jgi:nucleoside-diphosphate-sugar epimerase